MKSLKAFLISFITILSINGFAQKADSLQLEINKQVWEPLIQATREGNGGMMKALHSKDLLRVMKDNYRIMSYEEYFAPLPDSIKVSWSAWKRQIEIRFLQRIATNGMAYETGYYKTTSVNKNSTEKKIFYGKFEALLRKENGTWKILMIADANASAELNEELFQQAQKL